MSGFKKGDKVIWRVTSGFCTQEFPGEVDRPGKKCSYVLFPNREQPTGGHWLENEYLEARPE